MDEETACSLIGLRKQFPRAFISFLIEEMDRRALVTPGVVLSPSTVYRFLHSHGLMKSPEALPEDRRRFEAELLG